MDSSTDWQNTCTTNDMRMEHLLKEKIYVDCKFLVGVKSDQEEFSGHKVILSMVSPVFGTMFYGSLAETDLIKIPDITPKIFQSMMDYIYLQKCNLTSTEDAFELSYVAKKYSLKNLEEQCINYLKRNITSTNVCQIYEFAELCTEDALMEACKQRISRHIEDVLLNENFLRAKPTTVLMILDLNTLQINSELSLFNALQKYARANGYTTNTNIKEQLEGISDEASTEQVNEHFGKDNDKDNAFIREAVKKIRFLTMSPKEFSKGPANSELLTDYEGYSIILNILNPNKGRHAIPEGFCLIRKSRKTEYSKGGKYRTNYREERYCHFCGSYEADFDSYYCPSCDQLYDD